ncbi:MAG: glycosyltransferase family 2 protein [Bacteroidales bacterium]|nr:glycosyltransferase family 2 protein [Bacteroidales bacterium]
MTKVAVVILNWNGMDFLQKFLPKVIEYSNVDNTEIIVVDNGSSDGSLNYMKTQQPAIRIIGFEQNYGFAPGYVKALRMIKAEYFLLLNSDIEVTPDWLISLVNLMDSDPTIAASMPKIRSYSQRQFFEYAGAAGGFIDLFGYPFCRGRILNSIEKDLGQYDAPAELFWASGACLLVRASAYFEAGELDSDFFAHMEEIDLCWRFKRLGYKIAYCYQSLVYHVGGGTLPNNNPHKLYLNYRNNLYLLCKNQPGHELIFVLPIRIILDWLSAFVYITSSSAFFKSVFRAHLSFLKSLPTLIIKRRKVNRIAKKGSWPQIYKGSILFAFFFRGVRFFNQLKF